MGNDDIIFREGPDGDTFDLSQGGRILEYDVPKHDLRGALSRRRIDPAKTDVWIENSSGWRSKMSRR